MDPNETLRWLRRSADAIEADEYADDVAQEMTEQFRSLDEWLSKGGFLPADWSRSK